MALPGGLRSGRSASPPAAPRASPRRPLRRSGRHSGPRSADAGSGPDGPAPGGARAPSGGRPSTQVTAGPTRGRGKSAGPRENHTGKPASSNN
ncbi:hypothetical protein SLNWT_5653 [Streptomyces albus]|uniref:Uncharacterized protein n=1 Tax=Streptomyces albus (strain ATCC 21838 / DSM 41398 / FERM P-419 / JCM 4703 / NBRC 107858) TaxID=1081613 RepID=A0A0B5EW61_STRA4|nr:hypothetical protein SLNWT_5653 [Streptomyces albus]AOU80331.1 hypothetical protein SLNHY_5640 [Streptomyces albus]AYN36041.1 hypothetical protein DUI70_5547 [Streptomyces albus]